MVEIMLSVRKSLDAGLSIKDQNIALHLAGIRVHPLAKNKEHRGYHPPN